MAGFFAWVVAGWLRRSLLAPSGATGTPATPLPFTLGATDVTLALGALNVLFAAFVVAQIGWLFGGEALVLRTTGLSYAEYARRGFFELTWVAGLLLPVLLGAQALIPASDARTLRFYRRLAVPLVVLLGAIMFSAGARMRLYVQYYGISTDRLYASAFMIWLAVVFVWLALTVLRSRPRTFATGLVVSGFAVLFTLNVLNPDALVARANLARGDAGRSGAAGSDLRYVASLGGDAVPMLVSALTAPAVAADSTASGDRCAAASHPARSMDGGEAGVDDGKLDPVEQRTDAGGASRWCPRGRATTARLPLIRRVGAADRPPPLLATPHYLNRIPIRNWRFLFAEASTFERSISPRLYRAPTETALRPTGNSTPSPPSTPTSNDLISVPSSEQLTFTETPPPDPLAEQSSFTARAGPTSKNGFTPDERAAVA